MDSLLIDSFSEILDRVPLSIVQKKFRDKDLRAGRNAKDTLVKIQKIIGKKNEKNIESLQAIANWYFSDYLLHGEKSLYLFRLEQDLPHELFSLASKFNPEGHIFTDTFPFSLKKEQLQDVIDDIVLAAITKQEDKILITYCSIRYFTNKIIIPKSKLKESALEEYKNAEEITATSHQFRQFFDLIIIHKNGLVEIRIDNPKMDNSKQIPVKERMQAFLKVLRAFEASLSTIKGSTFVLPEPLNFFPMIDTLYLAKGEGAVRLLSFVTANGNAKQNKADPKRPQDCCRRDTYHEGGAEKVKHDLTPYRLHLAWNRTFSRPQVHLLGTVNHLNKPDRPLNEAIITRVEGKEDYESVFSKLLSYL